MNNDFVALIKERTDIVDLINQYVPLKQSGGNYKACCPFHKEKTPSFMVNPQRQSFKCFGCGKGGDIVSFIQEIEHVDFVEAISILADKAGLEVPKSNDFDPQKKTAIKEIKEINLLSARYFYKNLVKTPFALDYLKNRGVNPQMIREFGLGYADDSKTLIELLLTQFSGERILESGIARKTEHGISSIFKDRIIFPIFNFKNEIIAFGGRQLGNWGPKYLNSPETVLYQKKENLYGLQIAKKNIQDQSIFLVEGYMDVISMHQNGYKNTVATLGTALTEEQSKLLCKLADRVFVLYDSDDAGQNAAKKALELIEQHGASSRVITLDEEKDPDEFFKNKSTQEFVSKIESSLDFLAFNIQFIQKKHNLSSTVGKESFLKEAIDFIKQYNTKEYARQIYIEEAIYYLADQTGYSIKSIGTDIYGKYFSAKMFRKTPSDNETGSPIEKIEYEAENEKKEKMILNGLLRQYVSFDEIGIEDFVNPENRRIYHDIKQGKKPLFEEEFQSLTGNEYAMLIKSVKMTKLGLRIEFLEKVQDDLLKHSVADNAAIAIVIGNEIIRLKGIRNKM